MKSWVLPATLTTLGWAVLTATAQTAGTPVETPPVPLPPEKQAIVKEHVARTRMPPTEVLSTVTVGMTVTDTVELFGLPKDTVTEVPAVTRYRFFVAGNIIAVVEPERLRLVQTIQR